MLDPIDMLTPVLDTALDAVVVMRGDGTVAGWNAVAERVFGWTSEQALEQQLSQLVIPQHLREAHHRGLTRYLATGEGPVLNRHIEVTALRKDGKEFPVELSISPTSLAGQQVFLGFLRDISERKASEATIQRRAREAESIAALTSLAAEGSSFQTVMLRCLESVCAITGWKLAHAFCCSKENSERLEDTGIWHNEHSVDITPLMHATSQTEFYSGIGLPGRALQSGAPVWVTDVTQDTNFPRLTIAAAVGLRSAFAFPIRSGSRTLAVLEFFHNEAAEPDLTLWPTLQTLGEQVGRVLERSEATESLQKEREALLAEIARRQELEEHQQLLLNELNHRVKNTLAVVAGIAQQTAKTSSDVTEFNKTFNGRLSALSAAHSVLTKENWQASPLGDLIRELLRPFTVGGESKIILEGPEVTLQPKALLAISLIIHELLTNALKHGSLSVPEGMLHIGWKTRPSHSGQQVFLSWRERGLEGVRPPSSTGFGTKLLIASVRHELRGKIEQQWHADGLELLLEFVAEER